MPLNLILHTLNNNDKNEKKNHRFARPNATSEQVCKLHNVINKENIS